MPDYYKNFSLKHEQLDQRCLPTAGCVACENGEEVEEEASLASNALVVLPAKALWTRFNQFDANTDNLIDDNITITFTLNLADGRVATTTVSLMAGSTLANAAADAVSQLNQQGYAATASNDNYLAIYGELNTDGTVDELDGGHASVTIRNGLNVSERQSTDFNTSPWL